MDENKNITFADTIKWASLEKERRDDNPGSMSTSLILIGSVVLILFVIFLIYLFSGSSEENTLDMLKDEKYVYYGDETE